MQIRVNADFKLDAAFLLQNIEKLLEHVKQLGFSNFRYDLAYPTTFPLETVGAAAQYLFEQCTKERSSYIEADHKDFKWPVTIWFRNKNGVLEIGLYAAGEYTFDDYAKVADDACFSFDLVDQFRIQEFVFWSLDDDGLNEVTWPKTPSICLLGVPTWDVEELEIVFQQTIRNGFEIYDEDNKALLHAPDLGYTPDGWRKFLLIGNGVQYEWLLDLQRCNHWLVPLQPYKTRQYQLPQPSIGTDLPYYLKFVFQMYRGFVIASVETQGFD